jgi:hypothetical protein
MASSSVFAAFWASMVGTTGNSGFTIQDPALEQALRKRQEAKDAVRVEFLMKLADSVDETRSGLITRRKQLRDQLNEMQARIRGFMRAADYMHETGNFVPLAVAVQYGRVYGCGVPTKYEDRKKFCEQDPRFFSDLPSEIRERLKEMSTEDRLNVYFVPDSWNPATKINDTVLNDDTTSS